MNEKRTFVFVLLSDNIKMKLYFISLISFSFTQRHSLNTLLVISLSLSLSLYIYIYIYIFIFIYILLSFSFSKTQEKHTVSDIQTQTRDNYWTNQVLVYIKFSGVCESWLVGWLVENPFRAVTTVHTVHGCLGELMVFNINDFCKTNVSSAWNFWMNFTGISCVKFYTAI